MPSDQPVSQSDLSSQQAQMGSVVSANRAAASAPSASDAYAQLTRDQWSDYVGTFIPIENQLISYATDPRTITNAMSQASTDATSAFDASAASSQRRLQGLGIQLSPDEQSAQKLSFGLEKSLTDVQAQNTAHDVTLQRQASILGNPTPDAATLTQRSGV